MEPTVALTDVHVDIEQLIFDDFRVSRLSSF